MPRFSCPRCASPFEADHGMKVACPSCGQRIETPLPMAVAIPADVPAARLPTKKPVALIAGLIAAVAVLSAVAWFAIGGSGGGKYQIRVWQTNDAGPFGGIVPSDTYYSRGKPSISRGTVTFADWETGAQRTAIGLDIRAERVTDEVAGKPSTDSGPSMAAVIPFFIGLAVIAGLIGYTIIAAMRRYRKPA